MRSFEDRWNWLRAQLEDDAAVLSDLAAKAQTTEASVCLHRQRAAIGNALRHMDDADRNGPVEPL